MVVARQLNRLTEGEDGIISNSVENCDEKRNC
jgi:hypothetical protein